MEGFLIRGSEFKLQFQHHFRNRLFATCCGRAPDHGGEQEDNRYELPSDLMSGNAEAYYSNGVLAAVAERFLSSCSQFDRKDAAVLIGPFDFGPILKEYNRFTELFIKPSSSAEAADTAKDELNYAVVQIIESVIAHTAHEIVRIFEYQLMTVRGIYEVHQLAAYAVHKMFSIALRTSCLELSLNCLLKVLVEDEVFTSKAAWELNKFQRESPIATIIPNMYWQLSKLFTKPALRVELDCLHPANGRSGEEEQLQQFAFYATSGMSQSDVKYGFRSQMITYDAEDRIYSTHALDEQHTELIEQQMYIVDASAREQLHNDSVGLVIDHDTPQYLLGAVSAFHYKPFNRIVQPRQWQKVLQALNDNREQEHKLRQVYSQVTGTREEPFILALRHVFSSSDSIVFDRIDFSYCDLTALSFGNCKIQSCRFNCSFALGAHFNEDVASSLLVSDAADTTLLAFSCTFGTFTDLRFVQIATTNSHDNLESPQRRVAYVDHHGQISSVSTWNPPTADSDTSLYFKNIRNELVRLHGIKVSHGDDQHHRGDIFNVPLLHAVSGGIMLLPHVDIHRNQTSRALKLQNLVDYFDMTPLAVQVVTGATVDVGRSNFILQYIETNRDRYGSNGRNVRWLQADSMVRLTISMRAFAESLGLTSTAHCSDDVVSNYVRSCLHEDYKHEGLLIVLHNVRDADVLEAFLCISDWFELPFEGGKKHLLVTCDGTSETIEQIAGSVGGQCNFVTLGSLDEQLVCEYVQQWASTMAASDQDEASLTFESVWEECRKSTAIVLSIQLALLRCGGDIESISNLQSHGDSQFDIIVGRALHHLKMHHSAAYTMLQICSCYASDEVPLDLFIIMFPCFSDCIKTLAILVGYALVTVYVKTFPTRFLHVRQRDFTISRDKSQFWRGQQLCLSMHPRVQQLVIERLINATASAADESSSACGGPVLLRAAYLLNEFLEERSTALSMSDRGQHLLPHAASLLMLFYGLNCEDRQSSANNNSVVLKRDSEYFDRLHSDDRKITSTMELKNRASLMQRPSFLADGAVVEEVQHMDVNGTVDTDSALIEHKQSSVPVASISDYYFAALHTKSGKIFRSWGQDAAAEAEFENALEFIFVYRTAENCEEADVLMYKGVCLMSLGHNEEGLKDFHEANVIYSSIFGEDHLRVATAYHALAEAFTRLKEAEDALNFHNACDKLLDKQLLNLDKQLDRKKRTGSNLKRIIHRINSIGAQNDDATCGFLSHFQSSDCTGSMLTALQTSAIQRSAEAMISLDCFELQEQRLSLLKASNSFSLGAIMQTAANYEKSLHYFTNAGDRYASIRCAETDCGRVLYRIGSVYHELGNASSALEYLHCSLMLYQTILGEYHPFVPDVLSRIGIVYQQEDRLVAAESHFALALRIRNWLFARTPNRKQSRTLYHLGLVKHQNGDYADAVSYLEDALQQEYELYGVESPLTTKTLFAQASALMQWALAEGSYSMDDVEFTISFTTEWKSSKTGGDEVIDAVAPRNTADEVGEKVSKLFVSSLCAYEEAMEIHIKREMEVAAALGLAMKSKSGSNKHIGDTNGEANRMIIPLHAQITKSSNLWDALYETARLYLRFQRPRRTRFLLSTAELLLDRMMMGERRRWIDLISEVKRCFNTPYVPRRIHTFTAYFLIKESRYLFLDLERTADAEKLMRSSEYNFHVCIDILKEVADYTFGKGQHTIARQDMLINRFGKKVVLALELGEGYLVDPEFTGGEMVLRTLEKCGFCTDRVQKEFVSLQKLHFLLRLEEYMRTGKCRGVELAPCPTGNDTSDSNQSSPVKQILYDKNKKKNRWSTKTVASKRTLKKSSSGLESIATGGVPGKERSSSIRSSIHGLFDDITSNTNSNRAPWHEVVEKCNHSEDVWHSFRVMQNLM